MAGTDATDALAPSPAEIRLQRNLKIVVVVLAVLLFAGLAAIVGRIFYLASRSEAQPPAAAAAAITTPVPGRALVPELKVQLPDGAEVRSISLSGDRLAVHYRAGDQEGVTVLDLGSGQPAASVAIERAAPGAN